MRSAAADVRATRTMKPLFVVTTTDEKPVAVHRYGGSSPGSSRAVKPDTALRNSVVSSPMSTAVFYALRSRNVIPIVVSSCVSRPARSGSPAWKPAASTSSAMNAACSAKAAAVSPAA